MRVRHQERREERRERKKRNERGRETTVRGLDQPRGLWATCALMRAAGECADERLRRGVGRREERESVTQCAENGQRKESAKERKGHS